MRARSLTSPMGTFAYLLPIPVMLIFLRLTLSSSSSPSPPSGSSSSPPPGSPPPPPFSADITMTPIPLSRSLRLTTDTLSNRMPRRGSRVPAPLVCTGTCTCSRHRSPPRPRGVVLPRLGVAAAVHGSAIDGAESVPRDPLVDDDEGREHLAHVCDMNVAKRISTPRVLSTRVYCARACDLWFFFFFNPIIRAIDRTIVFTFQACFLPARALGGASNSESACHATCAE